MSKLREEDWLKLLFSLKKNSSNRSLTPLECAELLETAATYMAISDILDKIKISRDMYNKFMQLNSIQSKKIKKTIIWGHADYNNGLINMSIAKYIAKIKNEEKQLELYLLTCKHSLIKRELKDIIPEYNRGKSLSESTQTVVDLRVSTIKKTQIFGKIINKELSNLLSDITPKERNNVFKDYLLSTIQGIGINQCVLNDKNFFIDCSDDAYSKIEALSSDIERYLSDSLLKYYNQKNA